MFSEKYDIVVVGAGHAGCEAAVACARIGFATLLLTIDVDTVAKMSCNPAIGGLAKSHLVREIDALGGVMARAIDSTGIQFRMLNTGKGPAVQSLRVQADKRAYSLWMKRLVESEPNLSVKQGLAARVVTDDKGVSGIEAEDGTRYACRAAIITPGTFLEGLIHIGAKTYRAGRVGEPPSDALAESFRNLGLECGRLKTGTPARLDGNTIDFDALQRQVGDEPIVPFSFTTRKISRKQIPCYITFTNPDTHRIILDNLDKSPLYSGKIVGVGPRYCPSIEDKVVRFSDRSRHQIFLEPEGRHTNEIYPNGVSTSLPEQVQLEFYRTIGGLANVEFVCPGYAIEYTFFLPTQLRPTLEVKSVPRLYFAGQINGTSGYEEAAAQGLIAGINACLRLKGEEPLILGRDEAYTGVLIDDLITKGTKEPYRMFTSRAEYRLLLRQDNADIRLTEYGYRVGLIDESHYTKFTRYKRRVERCIESLEERTIKPTEVDREYLVGHGIPSLSKAMNAARFLSRPEVCYDDLVNLGVVKSIRDKRAKKQVEIFVKYAGYIARQQQLVERYRKLETKRLPEDIDYSSIRGLTIEASEKLNALKPFSLGQASRISGVSPADISVLHIYLKSLENAPKRRP